MGTAPPPRAVEEGPGGVGPRFWECGSLSPTTLPAPTTSQISSLCWHPSRYPSYCLARPQASPASFRMLIAALHS